jgi:hypothetical protein
MILIDTNVLVALVDERDKRCRVRQALAKPRRPTAAARRTSRESSSAQAGAAMTPA